MTIVTTNNNALFNSLPFDILVHILKQLTKTECLRCMQVCKEWYAAVPLYTEDVWSDLVLYGYHGLSKRRLWLQFIGPHVKSVTFQFFSRQKELYLAMQQLIDRGCNNILYLMFIFSASTKQHLFLPLLWKLTRHTIDISLTMHHSNLPFLWILKSCPKLTSFTYSHPTHYAFSGPGGFLYYAEPPTALVEYDHQDKKHPRLIHSRDVYYETSPFPNVTDLTMGVSIAVSRLYTIIQRCPNLEYLGISNDNSAHIATRFDNLSWFPGSKKFSFDFELLSTWCPKLKYLSIGYDEEFKLSDAYNVLYFRKANESQASSISTTNIPRLVEDIDKKEGQLQCLLACITKDVGPQQLAPTLLRNAATMKHLFLKRTTVGNTTMRNRTESNYDWAPELRLFRAPYLRSLILIDIISSGPITTLTNIFHHCPLLEIIVIHNHNYLYTVVPDNDVKKINLSSILLKLKQLKYLKLVDNFNLKFSPTTISSSDSYIENNYDDPVALFKQLAAQGSILETIEFGKFVHGLTDAFLLATTHIPTLKHLTVTLSHDRSYSDEGLCLFGDLLKNTRIEYLKLLRMRSLPRSFLQSLGCLTTLKIVSLSPNSWTYCNYRFRTSASYLRNLLVDGTGYLQMLHQSTSLQDISTFRCKLLIEDEGMDNIITAMKKKGLLHFKYELFNAYALASEESWIFKSIDSKKVEK